MSLITCIHFQLSLITFLHFVNAKFVKAQFACAWYSYQEVGDYVTKRQHFLLSLLLQARDAAVSG